MIPVTATDAGSSTPALTQLRFTLSAALHFAFCSCKPTIKLDTGHRSRAESVAIQRIETRV